MLYQVKQYFKFLIKSTNQHGVHSPFVYDLVTKCFYDKSNYSSYKNLSDYRKQLLNNSSTINIKDLGAGSHTMKTKKRSISAIVKNAGTTKLRAKLLFRLTNYFKPNSILELGSSLGISTHAMSLGNRNSKIITIEGCPNTAAISKNKFKSLKRTNIEIAIGDFNNEIEKLKLNTYDFIFFDGNHQKEATLHYFNILLNTAHNDSVFIFDDIYWSKGMTEAWEVIKKHPKTTVTIDTFFWGIVFFRKEQEKEHFTIRI